MSDFVPNNRYLGEVLIFFFHSKKTAAEAHRELQKIYGNATLSETTCRDWFRRFKDGNFDVDDYYLFRSWIDSKDEHFYRNGIRALPQKWEKL